MRPKRRSSFESGEGLVLKVVVKKIKAGGTQRKENHLCRRQDGCPDEEVTRPALQAVSRKGKSYKVACLPSPAPMAPEGSTRGGGPGRDEGRAGRQSGQGAPSRSLRNQQTLAHSRCSANTC